MDSNPVIQLAANSIYVATNQIMAEFGKFHWAIFITDGAGAATKYEWAQLPAGAEKAEGVVITNPQPVNMYSDSGVVTFGFFRITQFSTASPSVDYMKELTKNVFEEPHTLGYATIMENRKRALTCRTWAMAVYAKLQAAGVITREDTRDQIEAIVTAKSTELEAKLGEGRFEISEQLDV